MKKLSKNEASLIFSIHSIRHNTNEKLLALPLLLAFAFTLIGAPIITVLCDLPLGWDITLFLGPIVLATLALLIRKKLIFDHFLRVKDIDDKVTIELCPSSMFESKDTDSVLMFENSENMPLIVYNWFDTLGVLKDQTLHMGRMIYDNHVNSYLAVDINDLLISEENSAEFNAETAHCIRLSDVDEMGRIVITHDQRTELLSRFESGIKLR